MMASTKRPASQSKKPASQKESPEADQPLTTSDPAQGEVPTDLITLSEAAVLLHTNLTTLRNLVAAGELGTVYRTKLDRRKRFVSRAKVEALLRSFIEPLPPKESP